MQFKYPKPQGLDIELAFETKVLKLKSLHYGLWKKGQPVTLENIHLAQKNYTQHFIKLIPKDVKTILDVGAGIGDNAVALAKLKYFVTSISPDPNQCQAFSEITPKYPNIKFIQSKYEDLKTNQKFDLILMSESSNYFPLDVAMSQTTKYLKPGGYLLVAGLFRKTNSTEYNSMNIIGVYEKAVTQNHLQLLHKEDITSQVTPTLDLGHEYYAKYAKPAIDILSDYYNKAFALKAKLIGFFFKKELDLLRRAFTQVIPERLDSKKFSKHVRYLIYLHQFNPSL